VILETHIRQRLESRPLLLMTHVIVGYPSLDDNWRMLEIMAEVGVDLVELQMPFSEPVADGPTFVRANQEALARGMTVDEYFGFMSRSVETCGIPTLMMGYYNTAFRLGHQAFCDRLRDAGGVGYILPDLPWEEYGDLSSLSEMAALSRIMLMTPTNSDERLSQIGRQARGFVYAVARKGVTGRKTQLAQDVYGFLSRCRGATELPLALGFGLQRGDELRELQGTAEVAIVGSALLRAWEEGGEVGYREHLLDLAAGCAPPS